MLISASKRRSARLAPVQNIYNFYDDCGDGNQGVDQLVPQVASFLEHRVRLGGLGSPKTTADAQPHSGGQEYPCGTGRAAVQWCNNPSVRKALHMHDESFYGRPWALQAGAGMQYTTYTGASYDLYPQLLKHTPVLIYNGDVDACVPFNSNADWISSLAAAQGYDNAMPWRPWLIHRGGGATAVAGYVTSYATHTAHNLTFLTIKNSGHMVPQYQPDRALAFFTAWLEGKPFDRRGS